MCLRWNPSFPYIVTSVRAYELCSSKIDTITSTREYQINPLYHTGGMSITDTDKTNILEEFDMKNIQSKEPIVEVFKFNNMNIDECMKLLEEYKNKIVSFQLIPDVLYKED